MASMAVNAQWEMDQKTHTQELPQLESFESIDEDIPNESSGSVALHTRRELDVSDIALDPEIFDGDLASLQRLVIDSPVPVLLDIYADCTQFYVYFMLLNADFVCFRVRTM